MLEPEWRVRVLSLVVDPVNFGEENAYSGADNTAEIDALRTVEYSASTYR